MKPKVLISDKMDPNAARIFEERGCDVDVITGESPEELKAPHWRISRPCDPFLDQSHQGNP